MNINCEDIIIYVRIRIQHAYVHTHVQPAQIKLRMQLIMKHAMRARYSFYSRTESRPALNRDSCNCATAAAVQLSQLLAGDHEIARRPHAHGTYVYARALTHAMCVPNIKYTGAKMGLGGHDWMAGCIYGNQLELRTRSMRLAAAHWHLHAHHSHFSEHRPT
jgi:hypothetical protein